METWTPRSEQGRVEARAPGSHPSGFRGRSFPVQSPPTPFQPLRESPNPKRPGSWADDSADGRGEGVSLTKGWEMFPVSRESKLESLLPDRGWSQAGLRGPQGAPPSRFPAAFVLLAAQGFGAQPGDGCQEPPLSLFSRCPRGCVYRRLKPWLQEKNPGVRAEPPRHGFQEGPLPRPLRVSHGRAGGCNRARAARSHPAHGTGREGPLSPRRRRTRDFPELCPTRQVGVPCRISPLQAARMNFALL